MKKNRNWTLLTDSNEEKGSPFLCILIVIGLVIASVFTIRYIINRDGDESLVWEGEITEKSKYLENNRQRYYLEINGTVNKSVDYFTYYDLKISDYIYCYFLKASGSYRFEHDSSGTLVDYDLIEPIWEGLISDRNIFLNISLEQYMFEINDSIEYTFPQYVFERYDIGDYIVSYQDHDEMKYFNIINKTSPYPLNYTLKWDGVLVGKQSALCVYKFEINSTDNPINVSSLNYNKFSIDCLLYCYDVEGEEIIRVNSFF